MIESLTLPGEPGHVLLGLHRSFPDRYPVLLESAASGTALGRYSLLLARPGERLMLDRNRGLNGPGEGTGFLERLDSWWGRERALAPSHGWPFAGGWFLLLGYELAGEIEPSLRLPTAPTNESSLAWRMRAAIIHDHTTGLTVAVAEPGEEGFLPGVLEDLGSARLAPGHGIIASEVEEDPPERFLEAVDLTQSHIAAGDVYQANISRAWRARLPEGTAAADVYARLKQANPAPFAGIAALGECAIISSSPERLVSVRGRCIETRPIAGTRPRLGETDAGSIAELIAHPKERAEHVMLIDLERNDLGRLCEAGSVRVDEMMSIESYAHVHHIVSNVTGRLRSDVTPGAVIRALFPGGTITGCPKVRCMQLIGELENEGRGAYTGSMGYLGLDGDLDLNILIRTLTLQGDVATLRAGAGIVADSDAQRELDETRAKARGVLKALGQEP